MKKNSNTQTKLTTAYSIRDLNQSELNSLFFYFKEPIDNILDYLQTNEITSLDLDSSYQIASIVYSYSANNLDLIKFLSILLYLKFNNINSLKLSLFDELQLNSSELLIFETSDIDTGKLIEFGYYFK